jgi:hypothetical protein
MIVVRGLRGSGKTAELACISRAIGYPIVTCSYGSRDYIRQRFQANAIAFDELVKLRYDKVLVDEPETILKSPAFKKMMEKVGEDLIYNTVLDSVTIHAVAMDVVGFDTEHAGLIKAVHKFDMNEAVPLGKLDFLISYIRKNI